MFLGKILQKVGLFLLMGSLNIAMASSIREWKGSFDGIESEDATTAPRGLGEEAMPVEEDVFPTEAVEVATPKRQNGIKLPRKALSMVQFSSKMGAGIKDETATTGENKKKRLPLSVKRQEINLSPFMHDDIHQMVPHFLPIDFQQQGKAE